MHLLVAPSPAPASAAPADAPKATDNSAERDFHVLVLPLRPALVARACLLTRSRGEALDLVQDTLERALRGFHQFQSGTNVKRWLFRIMHNIFVDQYRRRARERGTTPIHDLDLAAPEPETTTPLWERLGGRDLHSLVGGLPPPFRDVIQLHFFEEQSYEDIGRSLSIPTATVGTRLLRARRKLRGLMLRAA